MPVIKKKKIATELPRNLLLSFYYKFFVPERQLLTATHGGERLGEWTGLSGMRVGENLLQYDLVTTQVCVNKYLYIQSESNQKLKNQGFYCEVICRKKA